MNPLSIEELLAELPSFNRLALAQEEIDALETILRIETSQSSKYYRVDDNLIRRLMTEEHDLCAHEVRINNISKIFFDIDIKLSYEQTEELQQIIGTKWEYYLLSKIMDSIISEFKTRNIDKMPVEVDQYEVFDKYKSSRKDGTQLNANFKMSWHLVMFPTLYCVETAELKFIAFMINNDINRIFKTEFPEVFESDLNAIDPQVYNSHGNLRMLNCAKPGSNAVKRFVYDEIIDASEIPSRHMITRTKYSDLNGDDVQLELIKLCPTDSNYSHSSVLKSEYLEAIDPKDVWATVEQITKIMKSKWKLDYIQHRVLEDSLAITYADKGTCPICDRIHERNQLYSIVNLNHKTITLGCFRNKSANPTSKGKSSIVLDFEGNLAEHKALPFEEFIDLTVSEEEEMPVETNMRDKEDELLSSFIAHKKDYENIPWQDLNVSITKVNTSLMETYPTEPNVLFIKSQMGTGKTKQLLKYMQYFITENPNAKIMILSFRISFSNDHKQKINQCFKENDVPCEFDLYSDLQTDQISQSEFLIIEIESLNKLGLFSINRCDLLILDESESLVEELNSNLSPREPNNFSIFEQLLRESRKIICMDAFLSIRTADIVCGLRNIKDEPRHLIENSWEEQKCYNFFIGEKSSTEWINKLIECIKSGKNVVVPCNVAIAARVIHKTIIENLPAIANQVCLYTEEINKSERKLDLEDLENSWKRYKVLIYSPTILAGISFEEEHYDELFGYYKADVSPVENFMQMSGRVRNIKDKTYNILIIPPKKGAFKPVTIEEIDKKIKEDIIISTQSLPSGIVFEMNSDNSVEILNQGYYKTFLHNERIKNLSENFPLQRFVNCIGLKHKITITNTATATGKSIGKMQKSLRKADFTCMKEATIITKEQATNLFNIADEELEDSDRKSIEKYRILSKMGASELEVDVLKQMKSREDIQQWIFLKNYVQMRKEFTSTRNYLASHRMSNVITGDGEDILEFSLENDAEYVLNSTANVEQNKLFEILLNSIGCHSDILDPDDFSEEDDDNGHNEQASTIIEPWLAKLCICNFLLSAQEHHLKHFPETINSRFPLVKLAKHMLAKIPPTKNKKEYLMHILLSDLSFVDKNKTKNIDVEAIKILSSILKKKFGVLIHNGDSSKECKLDDSIFVSLKHNFLHLNREQVNQVEIPEMSTLQMTLRKLCILLWISQPSQVIGIDFDLQFSEHREPLDQEQNEEEPQNESICKNINHSITNASLPRKAYLLLVRQKSLNIDEITDLIDIANPNCCTEWWNYALTTGVQLCQQIEDIQHLVMLLNYNYYNDIEDPIESLSESVKDIQQSIKLHI